MTYKLENPWPEIKSDPKALQDIEDWSTIWPKAKKAEKTVDPFQAAADFYLLFGLMNDSFVRFEPMRLPTDEEVAEAITLLAVSAEEIAWRKTKVAEILAEDKTIVLSDIRTQATESFYKLVDSLDSVFTEYMHLAIGGELRHHNNIGGPVLSKTRRTAWSQWRKVLDTYGIDALKSAAALFRDFSSGSFGGEPWAVAAELLYEREKLTLGPSEFSSKQMFIDRVFTLEHNTGCFLNKLSWVNLRQAPHNQAIGQMPKTVLAYQDSNPPNIVGLWNFASNKVQHLVKNYLDLAKENEFAIEGQWGDTQITPIKSKKGPVLITPKMVDHLTGTDGFIQVLDEFTSEYDEYVEEEVYEFGQETPVATISTGDYMVAGDFKGTTENFYKKSFKNFLEDLPNLDSSPPDAYDEFRITLILHYNSTLDTHFTEYELSGEELMTKVFYWKHLVKKDPELQGMNPSHIEIKINHAPALVIQDIPETATSFKGGWLAVWFGAYLLWQSQGFPCANT